MDIRHVIKVLLQKRNNSNHDGYGSDANKKGVWGVWGLDMMRKMERERDRKKAVSYGLLEG